MQLIKTAGIKNSFGSKVNGLSYFKIILSGRTKGNHLSGAKFSFPCVYVTKKAGLMPGIWTERLFGIKELQGDDSGILYQQKWNPARLFKYSDDFFCMLQTVQERSETINKSIEISEKLEIMRSLCRGVTIHARNIKIPRDVIEAVHRWRKEAFGKGVSIRLDLIDVYTTLGALAPTILEYSLAF